jgi:hypothetical protein
MKKTILMVFMLLLSASCVEETNPNFVSEDSFKKTMADIMELYEPELINAGVELRILADWNDPTHNAFASRKSDKEWFIFMFGGFARLHDMTTDSLALVVCHELGHHIGAAPYKYSGGGKKRWASAEGQSDYFAANSCVKRLFANDNNIEIVSKLPQNEFINEQCEEKHEMDEDQALCKRIAIAGIHFSKTLRGLRRSVNSPVTGPAIKSQRPDRNVVKTTNVLHPVPQCRFDTVFAGALCEKSYDENFYFRNPEEMEYNCFRSDGHEEGAGVRPKCWYSTKPIDYNESVEDTHEPDDCTPDHSKLIKKWNKRKRDH